MLSTCIELLSFPTFQMEKHTESNSLHLSLFAIFLVQKLKSYAVTPV